MKMIKNSKTLITNMKESGRSGMLNKCILLVKVKKKSCLIKLAVDHNQSQCYEEAQHIKSCTDVV